MPGVVDSIRNAVRQGKNDWSRYQEETRRIEQEKREEDRRRKLEEELMQLGPDERRIRWVQDNLLPVLKKVALSRNLTDFSSLREAAQSKIFPDDPAGWADTLNAIPPQAQFSVVLSALNRRWFIPQNLMILGKVVFKSGVAVSEGLRVVRIVRKEAYRYGGVLVPVYYIALIGAEQEAMVAAYLNDLGAIVVFPDRIAQYMKVKLQTADSPNYSDDYLVKSLRVSPPFYRAIVTFYRRYQHQLRAQYGGDEASYFKDLTRDRLQEEFRHWMDQRRVGIVDSGFLDNFVQTHLRTSEQGSMLRRLWEQMGRKSPRRQQGMAYAFFELSGQSYRAIKSADPTMTLEDWLAQLGSLEIEAGPYQLVGVFGIRLAAHQLRLIQVSDILEDWLEVPKEQLVSLALQLAERPEDFRQALREVFEREFSYPLDDAPVEIPYEEYEHFGGSSSTAGLEEKGAPTAGVNALLGYVTQPDVIHTIALLAESGKIGSITGDFPALEGLAKEAGFAEGVAAILRTSAPGEAVLGVPAEYAAQGIPVFIKKEWEGQIRENLSKLEAARVIRYVKSAAEAYLVIGDKSVAVRPDQAFIAINEETVSQVTPHLLQGLQISGLLKAGSVVMLYTPLRDSVLVFA